MCKKSESMTHIWVTAGCEESTLFYQIHKVLLFSLPLWANLSHSAPHPHKTLENGVARCFVLPFHSQYARHIQNSLNPILSWGIIVKRHGSDSWGALWPQKLAETAWMIFSTLNKDCLSQDRPRVWNWVIRTVWKWGFWKNFLACLWTKWEPNQFINNLCD